MTYRYLGLLAFVLLVCGLAFIVVRWPRGRQFSFSQHVAVARPRIIYYVLLFALTLPLLLLFFIRWFVPAFHISAWFTACVTASAAAQLACTFVPEVGGRKTLWHQILAGISGVVLLPALIFLLFSHDVSVGSKILTAMGIVLMAGVIGLGCSRKGRANTLILQSIYYAAFFLPVLFVSYLQ